jgi:hypothetical protein
MTKDSASLKLARMESSSGGVDDCMHGISEGISGILSRSWSGCWTKFRYYRGEG